MGRLASSAALLSVAAACVSGAVISCSSAPGYLVVAVTSDMQTPKDVDTFSVLVESGGEVKYDYVGAAPPRGSMPLPATLVIDQPHDPQAEVHVRVVGFHEGAARVVRDVLTTVPKGRSALLWVPLSYLDDHTASGTLPQALTATGAGGPIGTGDFDPRTVASACDLGQRQTSIDGACVSAVVDSASLADYDPSAVFGAGPCFDPAACFATATPATGLDPAACAVDLPGETGDRPRLALATRDGTGACTAEGPCFVPVDAASWQPGGRATLAPGVCAKIAAGDRLYVGGACAARSTSSAVCNGSAVAADGGVDATVPEAGFDATFPEASMDANETGSVTQPEAGPDCAAVLSAALSAPIVPPHQWAGLDLSNGGASSGAFASGGTLVPADLLACADSTEPQVYVDGGAPWQPGYRAIYAGNLAAPPAPGALVVDVNRDSRVVYMVQLAAGYRGRLRFHSRAGGAYGTHTYDVGIDDGSSPDGGGDDVFRDGVPFPVDMARRGRLASAWVDEIYDGLMATFQPGTPAVSDCLTTSSDLYGQGSVLPESTPNCLAIQGDGTNDGTAVFGVRPLRVYMTFDGAVKRVTGIYTFWIGGVTSCNTPGANVERMDSDGMTYGAERTDAGRNEVVGFGGIKARPGVANPAGLTEVEANAVECNGVAVPAPDPGYEMIQWGPRGEIAMEYNPTTRVNYKLFARNGYPGDLTSLQAYLDDGGFDTYDLKLGALTHNGAPVQIDWTSQASASAAVTGISNAWIGTWCGALVDTDCVEAGSCAITLDDDAGSSSFVLTASPASVSACGSTAQPLGFVFPKGTSNLTQVYSVNPGGK